MMANDMTRVFLHLPSYERKRIWEHLLLEDPGAESAGFLFVKRRTQDDAQEFEHLEWYPVPTDGFLARTGHHFELSDLTRAKVIKRAHDLEASIVEFHAHKGPWPACFSESDQVGFQEFVPHVLWRLKGRPYLAVVVTETDFDGLAWVFGPKTPQHIDGIVVDGTIVRPTQLSYLSEE